MQYTLATILGVVVLLALSTGLCGNASPWERVDLCFAKMTVTEFVYAHRDQITKEQTVQALEETWGPRWKHDHPASYVDLHRIVEDAYRKSGPNYRRRCCTEAAVRDETIKEGRACIIAGF